MPTAIARQTDQSASPTPDSVEIDRRTALGGLLGFGAALFTGAASQNALCRDEPANSSALALAHSPVPSFSGSFEGWFDRVLRETQGRPGLLVTQAHGVTLHQPTLAELRDADFTRALSEELWSKSGRFQAPQPEERLQALGRLLEQRLGTPDTAAVHMVAWDPQQGGAPAAGSTSQGRTLTPEQIRTYVNRKVCGYWLTQDRGAPGGGDQDRDNIPDRIDQDSYNGHGVRKGYPNPIPGARGDGHFNCEYFAMYFWEGFMATVGQSGGQCWIIHHDKHATVAWEALGHFHLVEPQAGSPYFADIPNLTRDRMPALNQQAKVGGATVYNFPKCNWMKIHNDDWSAPDQSK